MFWKRWTERRREGWRGEKKGGKVGRKKRLQGKSEDRKERGGSREETVQSLHQSNVQRERGGEMEREKEGKREKTP